MEEGGRREGEVEEPKKGDGGGKEGEWKDGVEVVQLGDLWT